MFLQSQSIGFELRIVNHMMFQEISKMRSVKCFSDLSGTNGWVIEFIADNSDKDVFQRDIEKEFRIRRSTASKMMKLMEQKGLIKRVPVDYDARLRKLVLTDKALELHRHVDDDMRLFEQRVKKGLSQEEINSLFVILNKIKENLA